MRNVLTIIQKEFSRFFRDKRLVLGTLLLPGLLIFVLYSFMGNAFATPSNEPSRIRVVHPSQAFAAYIGILESASEDFPFEFTDSETNDVTAEKEALAKGEVHAVLVFPENFDAVLGAENTEAPNVEVFYNSAATKSSSAFSGLTSLLDGWEDMMSNLFDVNRGGSYDIAPRQEAEASLYAMMLPFIIMTMLYSGCMGIAPESIAGEKERGTIATLLVTPIKRSELVVGKVLSLSALSSLSAISSFIGTFLSIPKLIGGSIGSTLGAYSFGQYVSLFLIMLSAVLIIVSLIAIISSFSKSVKEATTLAVPLMLVVMLVSVTSMFFTVDSSSHALFLIPIYNCVQMMSGIFAFDFSGVNLAVTLASNLAYVAALVFVLAKMFKSEKIMFNH